VGVLAQALPKLVPPLLGTQPQPDNGTTTAGGKKGKGSGKKGNGTSKAILDGEECD